jgi:pimeloyl-ACP methyl ester carboxylesterase
MMSSFSRRRLLACALALSTLSLPAWADGFTSSRITVKVEGSGSDVVLVPGLGSSPKVWEQLVKTVPGHRYHLVQVAGFAGAPKGGNGDGPVAAPVAEEVARYIQASGLGKPAVIGHSMGGSIGLMLAARHPEALSRLMVVDMLPFLGQVFGPPGSTPASLTPMADALQARMRSATPEARQASTTATIAGMVNTEAMRPVGVADSLSSDADVMARAYRELIITDLTPELARITVPVTVLYVKPPSVPVDAEQFGQLYKAAYAPLRDVTLKRIDGSAHFIMWDQPARFQDEVRAFLARE